MYEYQDDGIEFLRANPRAMLADEPGLGKSRQLLLAAEPPVLVVAPAMILDSGTWDTEIDKWGDHLDGQIQQVAYTSICDRERTDKGGTRPVPRLRPEFDQPWGTVILDESHYIKGRKTTWTEAIRKLDSERMYLATGTPIPNWAHEIFTALQLIRPEDARPGGSIGSYWRWVAQWFSVGQTRWSPMAVGDPLEDTPEFWHRFHHDNFEGRFLQRLRDDVLTDLPPMVEQQIMVSMGPAQTKAYREMKRDFITWLETGDEVAAWSKAAQTVRLAQICTGIETVDPDSGVQASAKLDAFADRIAGQVRPTVAVAHFRASCEAIADRAREVGRRPVVIHGGVPRGSRRAAVDGFRSGKYDVFVGSLDTISEGLTLVEADTIHFVERSWRPSRNEQALRRIHRIGQVRPVTAYHYVTAKTVDEGMLPVLQAKTDQQVKALRPIDLAQLA